MTGRRPERPSARCLEAAGRGELLAASTLTRIELLAGVRDAERAPLGSLFRSLQCVELTVAIADRAGRWAREYAASHAGIDAVDYTIAATAAELDAELWTLNVRRFPMFPELIPPY